MAFWILVLISVLGVSACSTGVAVSPDIDSQDVYFRDTEKQWSLFTYVVDQHVKEEASGLPMRAYSTWNEKWLQQIQSIRRSQENPNKYVDYIIETRQQAGLPPLRAH